MKMHHFFLIFIVFLLTNRGFAQSNDSHVTVKELPSYRWEIDWGYVQIDCKTYKSEERKIDRNKINITNSIRISSTVDLKNELLYLTVEVEIPCCHGARAHDYDTSKPIGANMSDHKGYKSTKEYLIRDDTLFLSSKVLKKFPKSAEGSPLSWEIANLRDKCGSTLISSCPKKIETCNKQLELMQSILNSNCP